MTHRLFFFLVLVAFACGVVPIQAAQELPARVTLEMAREASPKGDGLLLVAWIEPLGGYHAYAHVPGIETKPTVVSLATPDGTPIAVPVLYLPGERIDDPVEPGRSVMAYGKRTPVFIRVPAVLGGRAVQVRVSMLLCSEQNCWPFNDTVNVTLPASLSGLALAGKEPWAKDLALAKMGRAVAGGLSPELAARMTAGIAPGVPWAPDASGASGLPSVPGASGVPNAPSVSGASAMPGAGGGSGIVEGGRGAEQLPAGASSSVASIPPDGAQQSPEVPTGQRAITQRLVTSADTSASWALMPRYFTPALEVTGLGKALLLGLLAGLVLNVMPCVLPVVSLKLSAFIAASGNNGGMRARVHGFREHNLFFAAGILTWFVLLALILAGADMAWGQLFQRPKVVFGLMLIVFMLGLSMFGIFSLPVFDLKAGSTGSPRTQAFMTGAVATLLATPCSGPLLGGVLGWAFRQPPMVLALVFFAVGVGMALPYLLLAVRPGLVRFFPRPGAWTGILEQVVGFFLMGTTLYLLSVLPPALLFPALVTLLVTALAVWVLGTWAGPLASTGQRIAVRLLALLLICASLVWAFAPAPAAAKWESYNEATFRSLQGRVPVIVEFTADWCPNCKLLERTTLTAENTTRWARLYGARLIRVDLTRDDPAGQALLEALGSSSIPVVALFPKGLLKNSPLVLRDLFTPVQMEQALESTFGAPLF